MAIVIEDGTGKSNGEVYLTLVEAAAYFTARGNTTWAAIATDALREAALRKATEYMTGSYRSRWQGTRVYPLTQALDWPRQGVTVEGVGVLSTVIPEEIKRVCAELALRASAGELQADLTQGVLSEQVGPIAVTYDRLSPQRVRYLAVDNILLPYLKSGGSVSVGLVRC